MLWNYAKTKGLLLSDCLIEKVPRIPKQKWKMEVKKKRATAESGFIPYPVVALFKRR